MADRLSDLPDDILRRILHFAPLKEAVSTTALSRRWRTPLWLSSGAVNREDHCVVKDISSLQLLSESEGFVTEDFGRDALVTAALAALDAADVPVTRLTLRLESDHHDAVEDFMNCNTDDDSCYKNLVEVVFSHRAASRVEEFRLVFKVRTGYKIGYTVDPDSLPFETLQFLELTNCLGLYRPALIVLPRLSTLRLHSCTQRLVSLQRAVDGVEIDAPRLRRFRYMGGRLLSLAFTPRPLNLEQVDLHDERWANKQGLDLATFWRFARSFTSTREMRLSVNHLEEVAVLTEASRVELLPKFSRLKCLELHGFYWKNGDTAAVTIANLLRCCHVLCALRISLTAEHQTAVDASNKKGPRSRIAQKIMQIPALGPHHSLKCLQSSLARVGLQFWRDESYYFGLKLIEFFAENAMILEEMHVDTKLCKHINDNKTERWNSKRRKLGATCFVVVPHKR
ncbi:unnamed protein product [Alopecurus aequalis]